MTTDMDDLTQFDDLRELMTHALAEIDVPVRRLHDRALLDGRRLRRRRRVLVAAGGLAAAATVAAFAVPLASGSGSTATDNGYAGSPTAKTTTTAAEPAPFVDRPGYWDMPVADMGTRLEQLLPKRVTLASYEMKNTDHAPDESDAYIGYLTGQLDGPAGPGGVNVMLTQLSDQAVLDAAASEGAHWGDIDLGCPPEVSSREVEISSCSTRRDAAGRIIEQQLEMVLDGVINRRVRLVTAGGVVSVDTANSVQRKWTPPTSASRPPLTLDQLAGIATSRAWTTWTASGS